MRMPALQQQSFLRALGRVPAACLLTLLAALLLAPATLPAQAPDTALAHQLFVGTCYQPVDRSPAQITADIALMKNAGFRMVRIGDLSWDAIEPREGVFDFSLFDSVMDQLHAAGIRVLFDISGLPAPIWLHHRYPSVNLVDQHGNTLHPAERYMVDISDPIYRTQVARFAEQVIRHYAHHPALIAFGYDNEIGNGFMSYAEPDRLRFIDWLKQQYGSIDALNHAWATQRWSRHLNTFNEVELPYGDGPGPPERYLDLHRFWSDQTIAALEEIDAIRQRLAPGVPTASNLWDTAARKGFDYYKAYHRFVTYGAEGFYPGNPVSAISGILLTKGALSTPTWYNEFVTGGPGSYGGPRGILRMWAYVGLLTYGQTYLAWTFNTHLGGEEQALFGLLDHDGTPSWKYDEFQQIATEFATLQHLGFPRYHQPQVAIAYSFDSLIASNPPGSSASAKAYFSTPYRKQVDNALEPLLAANIDAALINLADDPLPYKLLIVPADYVMDEPSATAIRTYVHNGGTVIMTAFSAKVDEHSQWFATPLPGRLSDVFGLRTAQFYRAPQPTTLLLASAASPPQLGDGAASRAPQPAAIQASSTFYEVLEPRAATVLARFTGAAGSSPAITSNLYGKGRAIYVATPSDPAVLAPLLDTLYPQLGIEKGPSTPAGVYARTVEARTLYVNTTDRPQTLAIEGEQQGVLSGRHYQNLLTLPPYQVDLLQK